MRGIFEARWFLRPSNFLIPLGITLFAYGLTRPMHGFGRSRGNPELAVGVLVIAAAAVVRQWEHDIIQKIDVADSRMPASNNTNEELDGKDSRSADDMMKNLRAQEKEEDSP